MLFPPNKSSVFAGVLKWQRKIWNLVSMLHMYNKIGVPEQTRDSGVEDFEEWEKNINNIRNMTINNVS